MDYSNANHNGAHRQPPARLDARETAARLAFKDHDIPTLVNAGLLKPLGKKLEPNSPRYFACVEIERLAQDVAWLHKATDAVRTHWRQKNAKRSNAVRRHGKIV
jgi:hypothetical protein